MSQHVSVMLNEVLGAIQPKAGEIYVDGTFGGGGYTQAFLQATNCTVIAIDRDPEAIKRAHILQKDFGPRLIVIQGCFGDALELVNKAGFQKVDGFVLDVGVSSMQIDEAQRGFSFKEDGPLDMRMNPTGGETAADIVNSYTEEDLANLIYSYGQERKSRQVAKLIVQRRQEKKFETTADLAQLIRQAVPKSFKDNIDPATRSFQALRIAVNDEISELKKAMLAAEGLLRAGGRLAVVSFHSLEDGLVKSFLYERSGRASRNSRHLPESADQVKPSFSLPSKVMRPAQSEIDVNPRARSAKLRVAVRIDRGGAV